MTRTGKLVLLTTIGSVVALSIVVFGLLVWRSNRKGDINNEDMVLRRAEAAAEVDDPPAMALQFHTLTQLNQFKDEYKDRYYHALVRMRDFETLAAYTNERPLETMMTADERRLEELLLIGWRAESLGSNDVAAAAFGEATNLNYYAATPELIDCELRRGNPAAVLTLLRGYTKRFKVPRLVIEGAELSALCGRADLVSEFAGRFPDTGRPSLIFTVYCDALKSWLKGDIAAAGAFMKEVGEEMRTPLAKLIALQVACAGDDAKSVRFAWIDFMAYPEFLDFRLRGLAAAKSFIAVHFPDRLPIADLGIVAEEVLKYHERDLEVIRVSLLAKLASKTLLPDQLEAAEKLYPSDRGLKIIRERYLDGLN